MIRFFEISVEFGVDWCVYFVDLKNVSQRYFFDFYKKTCMQFLNPYIEFKNKLLNFEINLFE